MAMNRRLIRMIPNLLLLVFLIIAIWVRVVHLNADPLPIPFLDTRDEGLHSYAARSFYLWHSWNTDNFYYALIMPVFPLLQLVGVLIFGIHAYAFRLVSVVFSVLSICAVYIFIRRLAGAVSAIIAALLLSVNFYFVVFGRAGLPEATMMFFSLMTFIVWFAGLRATRHSFAYGFAAGLFFMFSFFTKESSVSMALFAVISLTLFFYLERKNPIRKKHYITLLTGFFSSGLFMLIGYVLFIAAPNYHLWLLNSAATLSVNRPSRIFLQPSYLFNDLRNIVLNDQWKYLAFPTFGSILVFISYVREIVRRNIRDSLWQLRTLLFCWLGVFLLHEVFMPAKFGRYLVMIILPLILLSSLLFSERNNSAIGSRFAWCIVLIALFADMIFNVSEIYVFIFRNPQYAYIRAVQQLKAFIRPGDLTNLPPHWIMNASFKTLNSFLIPHTDTAYINFYRTYGWPKYMAIRNDQIADFRAHAPRLFSGLTFLKALGDYSIYRVSE